MNLLKYQREKKDYRLRKMLRIRFGTGCRLCLDSLNKYSSAIIALFTVILTLTSALQWMTMKDTLVIGNRAWVNLYPFDPMIAVNEALTFPFRMSNEGKTPAQHFQAKVRVEIVNISDSPDFSFPKGFTDVNPFAIVARARIRHPISLAQRTRTKRRALSTF
jgi:hypothetical protein